MSTIRNFPGGKYKLTDRQSVYQSFRQIRQTNKHTERRTDRKAITIMK